MSGSPRLPCALSTVLGVLAFEEPAESPLAFLLTPQYAQGVADLVNDALLEQRDGAGAVRPPPPALEVLVRHVQATKQLLSELA